MTDREKTIAEIREKYNRTFGNVTGQMVLTHEQVQFLLNELDREREQNEKFHDVVRRILTEARYGSIELPQRFVDELESIGVECG
jgi:hypothetical protein